MSYNKFITSFKFDINNLINNGNELFYLENNNQIKGNTKFLIIDSPTSKIEGTINDELKIIGNLYTSQNLNILNNININKLNFNNIFDLTNNNFLNNSQLTKNMIFSSDNIILNQDKNIYAKDIIGEFIKLPNQNNTVRGVSGIQVEESTTNGKKHYLLTISSFNKNNQITTPTSYITYINESGINTQLSTSIINSVNPFFIEYLPPIQIDSKNINVKKTSLRLIVNSKAENWFATKNTIIIDTTSVNSILHPIINNNLMKSRYQLIIDLNGYNWNQGDEISFFMKLSSTMSDLTLKNNLASLVRNDYSAKVTNTSLLLNTYHFFNSAANNSFIFKTPLNPVLNSFFIFSFESNSTLNTVKIVKQDNTDLSPVINYNSDKKLYIYKWDGFNWILQDNNSFINYFYLYQYIIKLPSNNIIFNDSNLSSDINYLKYITTSSDNYLSSFNADFINISPFSSFPILNTLLFNYANSNNASFTLKYLGVNPHINKGIWIIK